MQSKSKVKYAKQRILQHCQGPTKCDWHGNSDELASCEVQSHKYHGRVIRK